MALLRPRDSKKANILPDTSDEYMRTNTNLSVDKGDAPSFERKVDPRLPKLFKYEYGGQNGWVTIPKGRIVSVVPDRTFKHFDTDTYYPGITIANGGQDVEEPNDDPEADEDSYTRLANKPVGVSYLNTYQDIDDEMNGNIPGIITRNTINLPLFGTKAEAEKTEWGSMYGEVNPGDKVKSDENGRFIKWQENREMTNTFTGDGAQTVFQMNAPLNPEVAAEDVTALVDGSEVTVAGVTPVTGEVELDSAPAADAEVEVTFESAYSDSVEQIVGQVLAVDENLIPAGWLKWVMPNTEDIEDPTGYSAGDLTDEGYPYDPSYGDFKKTKPTGIPGLTDGMNFIKEYSGDESVKVGEITDAFAAGDYLDLRLDEEYLPVKEVLTLTVNGVDIAGDSYAGDTTFTLDREDSGLLRIKLADDVIPSSGVADVELEFTATHQLPGMPTHIDFEGVVGSVDILLQL